MVAAAAAAEATRGRRLRLFSGLRVPPICLAHECAPGRRRLSAPQRFQGPRFLGEGGLPLLLHPNPTSPQPSRSPPRFSPSSAGEPEARVPCFLDIGFTIAGPQMRKTALSSAALARGRSGTEGRDFARNAFARDPAAPFANLRTHAQGPRQAGNNLLF